MRDKQIRTESRSTVRKAAQWSAEETKIGEVWESTKDGTRTRAVSLHNGGWRGSCAVLWRVEWGLDLQLPLVFNHLKGPLAWDVTRQQNNNNNKKPCSCPKTVFWCKKSKTLRTVEAYYACSMETLGCIKGGNCQGKMIKLFFTNIFKWEMSENAKWRIDVSVCMCAFFKKRGEKKWPGA